MPKPPQLPTVGESMGHIRRRQGGESRFCFDGALADDDPLRRRVATAAAARP